MQSVSVEVAFLEAARAMKEDSDVHKTASLDRNYPQQKAYLMAADDVL